jgi:protein-disulfide isomerase
MSDMPQPNTTDRSRASNSRGDHQDVAIRRQRQRHFLYWIGGATLVALVMVVALVLLNQDDDPASEAAAYEDIPTDGRFLGDPDAPVNFVVYSDFQCPFCKQFDETDLPKVIDNEVASGDVRVEWRPMPIISSFVDIPLESSENESVQASEAAICAADQNKFWPYSEALMAAQGTENSSVFSDEMLKETATDLDLDTESFNQCLDSGEKQDEVIDFRQQASDLGVQGTPTFLINDQLISYTAQGYDRLSEQLTDALEGRTVEN